MSSPCFWRKRSAVWQWAVSLPLSLRSKEQFLAGLVRIILETSLFHLAIRSEETYQYFFGNTKAKKGARTYTAVPIHCFSLCKPGSLLLSSRLTRPQDLSDASVLHVFSLLWSSLFLTFQGFFCCFFTFPVKDLCSLIICLPLYTCDKWAFPKPVLSSTAVQTVSRWLVLLLIFSDTYFSFLYNQKLIARGKETRKKGTKERK